MIDYYTLSVVGFFAVLALLIYRDRKNIDFQYILFMRRTKKFTKLIDKIAQLSPRLWRTVGSIAIVVCFIAMVYGTYLILQTAYLVYTGVINQPALQIALPIPSSQMSVGPGFIGIPFWFWIIIVAIILIPHETFHGVMARAQNIKLKNVGLLLLAIFPGAFVEPDEKQVKKSKVITKLRIFAAGTFINLTIGLLVLLLVQQFIWAPNVNGLLITNVNQTSPAGIMGFRSGMVIESINGQKQNMAFSSYAFLTLMVPQSNNENITQVMSSLILYQTLSKYKPGDTVEIQTNVGNYNLTLGEHPEIKGFPFIGINTEADTRDPSLFLIVFPLLGMIATLSIFVGIFNILPLYPLDGGLMIQAITDRFAKKRSKKIVMAIAYFLLIILLYSVFKPLIFK